ncbi:MAG: GldG family protein [Desulfobacterota bacterium]|nr:GldG family protein [Thermodesulfobacteriota bacterium]
MTRPSAVSRELLLHGIELALVLFFCSGSLVLVNYIAYRHNLRIDTTPERRFSLSEHTITVLRSLVDDVHATVFYRRQDLRTIRDVLELFARATPRFTYECIELEKNPVRAQALGISGFGSGVLTYKGRREKVRFVNEENLLSAIIKLIEPGEKIIHFVQGHGEKEISDTDEKTSCSMVRQALEAENYRVQRLLLMQTETIPEDTLVLIIAGPQKDFLPRELDMIDAYLRRGGRVLMLLDPFPLPAVEQYLSGHGITIARDFIIDLHSKLLNFDQLTPVIVPAKGHPIARYLNQAAIFPLCRSVMLNEHNTGDPIAWSSPDSWAERDTRSVHEDRARFDDKQDVRGPVSVGVALQIEAAGGQGHLVVIGNSNFVTNHYINVLGNKDFFLNTVNWLAEKHLLMSSRTSPERSQMSMFFLTENEARLVLWSAVVGQPALVLCVGIGIVVWRRMRR